MAYLKLKLFLNFSKKPVSINPLSQKDTNELSTKRYLKNFFYSKCL